MILHLTAECRLCGALRESLTGFPFLYGENECPLL
nr:MAG TPA: hypothetical protein [Caudoviricetes sp.]